MPDEPNTPPASQLLTEALLTLAEITAPIIDAVAGYKTALTEAGFGPEAADQMAADHHRYIVAMLVKGL